MELTRSLETAVVISAYGPLINNPQKIIKAVEDGVYEFACGSVKIDNTYWDSNRIVSKRSVDKKLQE